MALVSLKQVEVARVNARGQSSGYQSKPSQSEKFHDTLALGREVQAELDALGGFELKGIA